MSGGCELKSMRTELMEERETPYPELCILQEMNLVLNVRTTATSLYICICLCVRVVAVIA